VYSCNVISLPFLIAGQDLACCYPALASVSPLTYRTRSETQNSIPSDRT